MAGENVSVCLHHGSIHTVIRHYAVFIIRIIFTDLTNNNVNSGGDMKFSSYSSFVLFSILR